jgi:antitoxin component of RelBE/YafQ-DinJ toxin-antitoxin module
MSNLIIKQYRTEATVYTKAKKIAQKKGLTMSQLHRLLDEIAGDEERLTVFLDLRPKKELVLPPSKLTSQQIEKAQLEFLNSYSQQLPTLTNEEMDKIIYDL